MRRHFSRAAAMGIPCHGQRYGDFSVRKCGSTVMRCITGAPLSIVGALVVLQMPMYAQTDGAQLPVSIERIRAGLKEPPPLLRIPASSGDMPTFGVEVRERLLVLPPVDD